MAVHFAQYPTICVRIVKVTRKGQAVPPPNELSFGLAHCADRLRVHRNSIPQYRI